MRPKSARLSFFLFFSDSLTQNWFKVRIWFKHKSTAFYSGKVQTDRNFNSLKGFHESMQKCIPLKRKRKESEGWAGLQLSFSLMRAGPQDTFAHGPIRPTWLWLNGGILSALSMQGSHGANGQQQHTHTSIKYVPFRMLDCL